MTLTSLLLTSYMVLSTAPTPPHRVDSFYRNRLLSGRDGPSEDTSNHFYQGSTAPCPAPHSGTAATLQTKHRTFMNYNQRVHGKKP